MKKPPLRLAVEFNKRVREDDEWFDEPDDLDRVERALASIDDLKNPLGAAGILAYRVTLAQGFAEGNKRTALLLARWLLDSNGVDGAKVLPQDDRVIADLLVQAASGTDVEAEITSIIEARA
ncbi:MAG: Fic family protein [Acidimicrobiia bacterium]